MRNAALQKLNFVRLIDYGGQPPVENRYDSPLPCSGYCIDCEQKDLLDPAVRRLDLMSHAADTSDFEALPLDVRGRPREPLVTLRAATSRSLRPETSHSIGLF
jgi:hypothetical protein